MCRIFRLPIVLLAALLLLAGETSAATLEVHFIDVGQGDAIFIRSPGGKTVLIDAGTPDAGPVVAAYLTRLGVGGLDLAIATHPHLDHVGGMLKVLQAHRPALYLDSGFVHPLVSYERLVRWLDAEKVPAKTARGGRNITLEPGVVLELLAPTEPFLSGTRSDPNSNSVVARLTYKETSFLFTGDSEADSEQRLLGAGTPISATVLKVAHHGGRHSTGDRFLAKVAPKFAVISCGKINGYRHPSKPTLEKLSRAGVEVFRTDDDGDVIARTDGHRIDWEKTLERSARLDEPSGSPPEIESETMERTADVEPDRGQHAPVSSPTPVPAVAPAPRPEARQRAAFREGPGVPAIALPESAAAPMAGEQAEVRLNVNLASLAGLTRAGFPVDAARRVLARRSSTGPFRSLRDVGDAAGLDERPWRELAGRLSLRVGLNGATEADLVTLGCTRSEARAIVDHRRSRGRFRSLKELEEVEQLGVQRREQLRALVTLDEEGR
jgi:competence protein ComEC